MSGPSLSVGQKIELNDGREGFIRFVGVTAFQTGDWVGVELEDSSGKNDGSVQGQRYFKCEPSRGIFCRPTGVNRVLEEPKPKLKAVGTTATKARPSSVYGTVNGAARRQTLVSEGPGKRASIGASTPTPAARLASGVRSPVKSPTKQLSTNGVSSTSTSRTSTPPVAGKRPAAAAASTRSSTTVAVSSAAPGRRTSTLASGPPQRSSRLSLASTGPPPKDGAPRAARARNVPVVSGQRQRASDDLRLSSTTEEISDDAENERNGILSPRDSTDSAASHPENDGRHNSSKPNFAPPPPAPPVPSEASDRTSRSRRPSSPTAASIHSQRTIRSTAASTRQIEELEAKVRLLERKRLEDRDLRQNLETAQQERDHCKGIIDKLQSKYRPQQLELEKLKRELGEQEQHAASVEDLKSEHEQEMESALLDREVAEETAECLKADLEILRAKNEEMQEELEILREESVEMNREMNPEERASAGWMQLQTNNERLREALLSLRDMTRERESELKVELGALEGQLKDFDNVKNDLEDTKEKLMKTESDTVDLRQQLEVAVNAEEMIEQLTEDNMNMRDRVKELRGIIEDLENLKELNDELEYNHVEAEKQMQEEIDFKDSLLLDRERTAKEQQSALDEADYNIDRFRDLVRQLQSDLQDLEASKQISETEAAELSSRSKAMVDLNMKLQSSAAKTQLKTIDLELRRLEAQEASEQLAIVQLFLPDAFQAEQDSVLALLRFRRIGFKATLVQSFLRERIASFGTRGDDEQVFVACDVVDKLTWIASMCERFANSASGSSVDEFTQYGSALYELDVVERTVNDYIEGLRREDLRESDMTIRLGRSIEVMTHLASLHISDGMVDHADHLYMKTGCVQSHLESAISALVLTKTMIEDRMKPDEDSEDASEAVSDIKIVLNRLRTIIELARSAKVVSGKTHRAVYDLQTRSLTLELNLTQQFDNAEHATAAIAIYARQTGASIQRMFGEEGRSEAFKPSEVNEILSQASLTVFQLPTPEAGPYSALTSRLRDVAALLAELSSLPIDLDNTVEFERAPAPWNARADQLKKTKVISIDTEAELARARESIKERNAFLKDKESELEAQSVRIEMLEARMKDASKRSAKIAELERALQEAKDAERKAKSDLSAARQDAQRDVDWARGEMSRLADERRQPGHSKDLDSDAVGANTRVSMKRQEHKIAALEGAVRYLKEEVRRLGFPAPDAPLALAASSDWLHTPLGMPSGANRQRQEVVHREGAKILEQLLDLAARPHVVDLTKVPENKLAWRPAKERSRWKVEQRNEEWLHWKQWRQDVLWEAHEVAAR